MIIWLSRELLRVLLDDLEEEEEEEQRNDDGSLSSHLTMAAAHLFAVNRSSSSNVLWPQGVRLLVHWSAVGEKEAETDRQTD